MTTPKDNITKGKGKIKGFEPVDKKADAARKKATKKPPKHDDGFNIGTFPINPEPK